MSKETRDELYGYIVGVLENNKCHPFRINGVEDHIHILTHIHPTVSLSDLVKDIKISTSKYIKEKNLFVGFTSWQEGYGAFTYSMREKEMLVNYIKNQEEHHRKKTFKEEYIELLEEHEIEFDEKYFL